MSDQDAYKFERKNPEAITIDSQFKSTTYIFIDDHLIIDGGLCGRITIFKDNLKAFMTELSQVVEDAPYFTEKTKAPASATNTHKGT